MFLVDLSSTLVKPFLAAIANSTPYYLLTLTCTLDI